MVAVDVDTGSDFSKNAAATANLAACAALPRQLRLRGLGGVVLVDFAPVKKGARQGIENALKRAFASDPVETVLGGWTPLGNFEIQRKRERRPFAEVLAAHG
jgi:Ribonuclease G/E